MMQMLQMNKNINKKNKLYTNQHPCIHDTMISISDLATRQIQAYYMAAHYTIKTSSLWTRIILQDDPNVQVLLADIEQINV